jgi:hypothetical protein
LRREQRALGAVPKALWALLAASLTAQVAWQARELSHTPAASELPPPPSVHGLRLASFAEPEAAARLLALYVQSFDLGAANSLPYQKLDYGRLVAWLRSILELDPRGQYPLFLAARVYAENTDPVRARLALDFVYQQFFIDPNRRWPWLAHAALTAKHRLADLPLARRYASAVQRYATAPDVPLWAKQMEVFILEDMNELDAARIMLGGMLESGMVHDPAELRFLRQRLQELEGRIGGAMK